MERRAKRLFQHNPPRTKGRAAIHNLTEKVVHKVAPGLGHDFFKKVEVSTTLRARFVGVFFRPCEKVCPPSPPPPRAPCCMFVFFFPGVFLHSRVTGACPVTTDFIMRAICENNSNTTLWLFGPWENMSLEGGGPVVTRAPPHPTPLVSRNPFEALPSTCARKVRTRYGSPPDK